MADSEVATTAASEVPVDQAPAVNGSESSEAVQVSSTSSKRDEVSLSVKSEDAEVSSKSSRKHQDLHDEARSTRSGSSRIDELDVDRDYTTRLLSSSGGFTSSVRENILSHPVVLKNRSEPSVASYISTESRQVMRKGFDIGIASPGLRMLYDVSINRFLFYHI